MSLNTTNTITAEATAAISADRFVIRGTGSTDLKLFATAASAATSPILGVCTRVNPEALHADYDDAAAAGDLVNVATIGGQRTYLVVNGNSTNIAIGDPLTATTAGVGIKATTNGQWVGAIADAAATADGVRIPVTIANFRLVVPA